MRSIVVLLLLLVEAQGLLCTDSRSQWTREDPPGSSSCSGTPFPSLCYVISNSTSKTSRYGCTLDMRFGGAPNAENFCHGRTVERCKEAMFPVDDVLSLCCCKGDLCNEPMKGVEGPGVPHFKVLSGTKRNGVTNTPGTSIGGILVGAIAGVALIAVVVVGAVAGYRKYQRVHPPLKSPKLLGEETGAVPYSEATSENPSSEKSVADRSELNPVVQKSSQNAVHVDCTETVVPAQISEEEQYGLMNALKTQNWSKGLLNASKRPMIEKVVAFGTSDDITVIGSMRQAKEDHELSEHLISVNVPESLLERLIRNGPRQFSFSFVELVELLEAATACFAKEPSLLQVPVPCVVYGDIHGQYSDLHRWFNLNGWPHKMRSVFLGDFVDRGTHGIEVVALLAALKVAFPEQVFICRGNHEEESLNKAYSFYEEVCLRFPSTPETEGRDGPVVYSYFKKLFTHIPLAALMGGRVLGMHGGISPKMESLDAIRRIARPIDDFEVGSLACDLVWSDPDTDGDRTGFRPNFDREPHHGIGQLFTAEAVKSVCRKLGIDFIIRGHQAPLHGYALFADGHLMTLFSAPGYKGSTQKDVNMGACVEIQKDMTITIKQLKVSEKFRRNRVDDVERMKATRKLARKLRDHVKESKTDSCEKL